MAIVTSVALAVSAAAQQPLFLDLTAPPQGSRAGKSEQSGTPIETGRPESIRGGISPAISPAQFSVRIELKSLTPDSCVLGEEILYEIVVANTGAQTLVLPWSPVREAIPMAHDGSRPRYQELTIALVMDDNSEAGDLMGSVGAAFGSEADPETLQPLLPGQHARIRASATCRPQIPLSEQRQLQEKLPHEALVYARLSLKPKPGVMGASVSSPKVGLTILSK